MRCFLIACVVLASVRLAWGQPAPPADLPPVTPTPADDASTSPAPVVQLPPPPPAPKAKPSKADRLRAEAQCAARDPGCDWLATLGGLERLSVTRAMTARGYELDPMPWGKRIRTIHVYNEDVFAEGNRLLQFLNNFHVTTKEYIVRREVVVASGDVWDPDRILESARRLRDPLFTSVVVVLPVKSGEADTVDVLVVTRDIWSLRLNTQYTYQDGRLTDLITSLSENNFFGMRKVVAAALTMDQGKFEAGPLYIDKNFLGKYLELRARVNTILNRDALLQDGEWVGEGSSSTISVRRQLWKLASRWGGGASFTHRNAIERRFDGTSLRPVWCPLGIQRCQFITREQAAMLPADEQLPYIYRTRRYSATASAVRQFGTDVKQQVSFGYTIDSTRPRLLEDFPGISAQREPFERAVLPVSELESAPFVSYALFTPRFKTRRNVHTYDLAEDYRLGPDLEASYGVGLRAFGSTYTFQRGGVGAGYTLPWGRDGSARAAFSVTTRYQDGEFRDNAASFTTRFVSPSFGFARIVAENTLATRWNERVPGIYTIGSDNGLRGFRVNQFFGRRLFGTQIEARSIPTSLWVLRLGGVVFYEVGGAANTLRELFGTEDESWRLHHDVGVGFRMLLPQTSRELFRFDFAFPLDGPTAGRPKFSAGFQSEF